MIDKILLKTISYSFFPLQHYKRWVKLILEFLKKILISLTTVKFSLGKKGKVTFVLTNLNRQENYEPWQSTPFCLSKKDPSSLQNGRGKLIKTTLLRTTRRNKSNNPVKSGLSISYSTTANASTQSWSILSLPWSDLQEYCEKLLACELNLRHNCR